MYWDTRVMQKIDGQETLLHFVNVYYQDDGTVIGWTEGKDVYGENLAELRVNLNLLFEALDKPVLIEVDLLAEAEVARLDGEPDLFSSQRLSMDELLSTPNEELGGITNPGTGPIELGF